MRLDQALVTRHLVPSRTLAQKLIEAGTVAVNGTIASKASRPTLESDEIIVIQTTRFVSRGGEKLDHALETWEIEVIGRDCLDVGASTGGFTDCLLQRGAARVYCLDSGSEQLRPTLRQDPRVSFRERFNARHLEAADLPFVPQLAVMDVSFISQTLILPALAGVLPTGAELVTLVKPQFELSPAELGKNGIVRDAKRHKKALERVTHSAKELGFTVLGTIDSPIEGGDGNREFLLWLRRDA